MMAAAPRMAAAVGALVRAAAPVSRPPVGVLRRAYASSASAAAAPCKVAVLGAAGGIGQPLSLLLKSTLAPFVNKLALYDVNNVHGVAADISHIDTPMLVSGHVGDEQIADALRDAAVVIIPAGIPRKPNMTRDDLFNINAGIVHSLATSCAKYCSKETIFLLISNPINSTVPIFQNAMLRGQKSLCEADIARRVIGVTYLDAMRASAFVGEACKEARDTSGLLKNPVSVVGGHSGPTILPLFSQHPFAKALPSDVQQKILHRIQYGGDEVVKAKNGAGSATLSMAVAAARFAEFVLKSRCSAGSSVIQPQPGFVRSPIYENLGLSYFASNISVGPTGITKIYEIGKLSDVEKEHFEKCVSELKSNIAKGLQFAETHTAK